LNASLEKETAEKENALDDIVKLKSDLEKQKDLRSELETKLTQKQKDVEKTQAQTKDLENKKTELETKIKDLEAQAQQAKTQAGVDLGTVVVGPEGTASIEAATQAQPSQQTKGLEGKVLVVNKEYNFMVINLGSRDGVSANDIFSIYHNNNYIGDVKVSKAHDAMSAADFLSSATKDQVSEGDRVAQKTK
jgi:predicted nuclease with TOPRIM domain